MSMRLLKRYYLRGFLKLFFIVAVGLSFIMSLLELIEKIDDFRRQISPQVISLYVLYSFPKYFSYIMPLAGLLSSLFILGQAGRRKETLAIMSAGGRIKKLLMPFIFIGVFLSLLGFSLSEFVLPHTSRRAEALRKAETKTHSISREGTIWLRARDGSIVRLNLFVPERGMSKGASVFRIENRRLKERIEVEEAIYETTEWVFKNVIVYKIESGGIKKLNEMRYPYLESPRFLSKDFHKPEEMGIIELRRYVMKLTVAGFKNTRLHVDMNSKMSYPLVNLFMLILGISLSIRRGLSGLLASGVGIIIGLLYWLGYTMALSLGYAGILPPFLSAWSMPLIFSIVAVYLFVTIPE